MGNDRIRYCGTPLKYSFSEAKQQKSVTLVELAEKGQVQVRTVPLVPRHDLREIRGTYLAVTEKSFYDGTATDDYLHITLTDEQDVPDALARLRVIYPNLMRLDYDNRRTRAAGAFDAATGTEIRDPFSLFAEFYELQNNLPLDGERAQLVRSLFERLREEEKA